MISQSGETADTLAALRESKEKGARVLGIVNVVGSSIARESDNVMYTWAGPEIAVATTKAYSAQLVALYLLAMKFANVRGNLSDDGLAEMLDKAEASKALPEMKINRMRAAFNLPSKTNENDLDSTVELNLSKEDDICNEN